MTPKSRAAVSGDAGSGNEAYANDLADLAAGEPGPNGADDPNGDHPDSAGHPEGATRRRRRRTAPRAHGFWRLVFPVIVVASALAVALLAVSGFRTLLDSTVGTPENPGESNPRKAALQGVRGAHPHIADASHRRRSAHRGHVACAARRRQRRGGAGVTGVDRGKRRQPGVGAARGLRLGWGRCG